MDKLLLITLTILVVMADRVTSQIVCEPTCTGTAGSLMGSLCDCSQYYVCLEDGSVSDNPITCPTSAPYFDESTGVCGTDPSVCITIDPIKCPVLCKDVGVGEDIVEPQNCGQYFVCTTDAQPQGPLTCPGENPYFNGVECVSSKEECCAGSDKLCQPYCSVSGIQIIDPTDCTKYYVCLIAGPPDDTYHSTCNVGENFDMETGHCSETAECITLCVPQTGGGGSGDCKESMQCTESGVFPMCTTCQKGYFDCLFNTGQAIPRNCTGNTVFNPDLSYAYCVDPADCPHEP